MFVRLYSLGCAGASTGEVGGVVEGATGADAVTGAVNWIGATGAAESETTSVDFMWNNPTRTVHL